MGLNHDTWTKTKYLVNARDGGKCLRCFAEAQDVHHRVVRGMGGTSDPDINYGLPNLVSVCRQCHDDIHANPEEAYELGWLVHSWDDPAEIPLTVKPGTFWVRLTTDGDMIQLQQMTLF